MKRLLALRATIVATIALALMTLVVVPPAAAKDVIDGYNVIGPGARASGSGCTYDHPEEGDSTCSLWIINFFAGVSHVSWDLDKELLKPYVCPTVFTDVWDDSEGLLYNTWRGGCLVGQKLSLAVAKDLSSASAEVTVPTDTSTCVNDVCTEVRPGDPIVVDLDWVGVGEVTSVKWRQTSDQGGDCYSIESLDGDRRSATVSGTIDGVPVPLDDALDTDIWDGHETFQYICPK